MSSEADAATAVEEARNIFEYPVFPSTLKLALRSLCSNHNSSGVPKTMAAVMVWGAMGIGKSQIVNQVARDWGCRTVALHLPQFDPTDIKGVPVYHGGKVAWIASSYLPQERTHLFDETAIAEATAEAEVGDTGSRTGMNQLSAKRFKLFHRFEGATDVKAVVMDLQKLDSNGRPMIVAKCNDGRRPDFDLDNVVKRFTVINPRRQVIIEFSADADPARYVVRIEDKALLFLDELSAAAPETMNAALQLVLDRRVGEYDLPPDVPVVAAGNRESDAAFVNPMPAPLANRFCHLRLQVNLDDWIAWALEHKLSPDVIGFLKWKGRTALAHFEQAEQIEGDLGFPSPRSWALLSEQMDPSLEPEVVNAIIAGFIGKARGHEFVQHRAVSSMLPSTDDILQGKEVKMPGETDNGQKYALAIALSYKLQDYYDKYYDESIHVDDIDKQPKEWLVAGDAFANFIDAQLGPEMSVLCIHIVSRVLNLTFTKFAGANFEKFAKRYRHIIRGMVMAGS